MQNLLVCKPGKLTKQSQQAAIKSCHFLEKDMCLPGHELRLFAFYLHGLATAPWRDGLVRSGRLVFLLPDISTRIYARFHLRTVSGALKVVPTGSDGNH